MCFKHGGNGKCIEPGCTSNAARQKYCLKHGNKKYQYCGVDQCSLTPLTHGMCATHADSTFCKVRGCKKKAEERKMCTFTKIESYD